MRKITWLVFLIVVLAGLPAFGQAQLKPGSLCLAFWEPNNLYYIGTVVEKADGPGYRVVFADGDVAVVNPDRMANLSALLKVGTPVLAMWWQDKKFYPGKIAKIVGAAAYIKFDDGDEGWTSAAGIAVKPETVGRLKAKEIESEP